MPKPPSRSSAGSNRAVFDTVIVGGGPAGMSAALILARCRRSIVIIDADQPRNARARIMHGFLSRDGIPPARFRNRCRSDLKRYGVPIVHDRVIEATKARQTFSLRTASGKRFRARTILLATGTVDVLPRIDGLEPLYGSSVHHCPYCDGWEWRDHRLAAYGRGDAGAGLALALKRWSDDVIVFFDGKSGLSLQRRNQLRKAGITMRETKIARLEGARGMLKRVVMADGEVVGRDALFFNTSQRQRSTLAEQLGCEFTAHEGVRVDKRDRTCIQGVYVAGDALREVQFVISAAGAGAIAAVGINSDLQRLDGLA